MEKRILLAFVLCFGVLYGFRLLFPPQDVPPPPIESAAIPAVEAQPPVLPAQVGTSPETPVPEVRAEAAEDVVIETPLYRATLSNQGGVLTSFRLREYLDAEGKPTELIDQRQASTAGWPLAIASGDVEVDRLLARERFVTRRSGNSVSMELVLGSVQANKTVEFDADNYKFKVTTRLSKDRQPVAHRVIWQGGFGDQSLAPDPATKSALYSVSSGFERIALGSVGEAQSFVAPRVGVEDQYFLAMLSLPQAGAVKVHKSESKDASGVVQNALRVEASVDNTGALDVYVGPKSTGWLRKAVPQLEAVVDYGWFEIFARPLLAGLLWIHGYVGNFGWAIIILTCIINIILFPLRVKSQVSMQKMQDIQPQMKTLQDRYKKLKVTDPRRAEIQAEIMNLYKQHGVNPMGGCLPIILQMPLLIGFYNVLSATTELRGAPWILWIQDLSKPDPYYIIPILMAVSMVVQQKMTPSSADPAQARIMMIMPLMMTVLFLWAQSGLTLYWLTSTVVGVGQQWVIRKYWSGAAPSAKPQPRQLRNKLSRGN